MYLLGSPETYGILSTTKTQNENVTSCSASKYMNHALKSKCRYVNPYPQKTVLKGWVFCSSLFLGDAMIPVSFMSSDEKNRRVL